LGCFVARYSSDGTFLSVQQASGGTQSEGSGVGLTRDADGNYALCGMFAPGALFGTGLDTVPMVAIEMDAYLASFDSAGSLNWAAQITGLSMEAATRLGVHTDGSVAVTGAYASTAVFAPTLPAEVTHTAAGEFDIFVAKYDSGGALSWVRSVGGAGTDIGYGVAIAEDGCVIAVGQFANSVTFGQGVAGAATLNSAGETDIYIVKYNPEGTLAPPASP